MNKFEFSALTLSLLFVTSCATGIPQGRYALVSTRTFDLSQTGDLVEGTNTVTGYDRDGMLIVIPLGMPKEHRAIEDAISKVDGAVALKDVTIRSRWWYVPYIYGVNWYEATGTPLINTNHTLGAGGQKNRSPNHAVEGTAHPRTGSPPPHR